MAGERRALASLAACLRGAPPADIDWMQVIALANRSLTTPALAHALAGCAAPALPSDVRDLLGLMQGRNADRNRRLKAQMSEAVEALNGIGIVPVLLKGAATLATCAPDRIGARMLSDLDLLVAPAEVARTVACLRQLGYRIDFQSDDPDFHVPLELSRPHDVGIIDLHRRPPGPAALTGPAVLDRHSRPVALSRGQARVPSPTLQVLHLVLHDQLHDGDYFRGRIDLRHLLDIRDLAGSGEGIDWPLLASLMPGHFAQNALATQLVTANRLLAVPIPARFGASGMAAFQFHRRLAQLEWPLLRKPMFLVLALLELKNRPSHRQIASPGGGPDRPRRPLLSRLASRAQRIDYLWRFEGYGKL